MNDQLENNLKDAIRNDNTNKTSNFLRICNIDAVFKRTRMKTQIDNLESADDTKSIISPPNSWYGARHTQAIMLSLCVAIAFAMRINLSVAIVAMTTPNSSANPDVPTYHWTDQSIILSSYYWGYVTPQVVAGSLSKKYGAKWFLTGGSIFGVMFTFLIPTMSQFGSWALILFRVLQGFSHGVFFPSCNTLLTNWVPSLEKSRISAFVYSAGPLGFIISMPFTGWISETWLGWPYSFYVHAVVGLVWTIAWIFIGKDSPADHKSIDPEELKYIQCFASQNNQYTSPPWKSIVTSLPLWAILISTWGQVWGFSLFLTNIPTYLASVLGYNIKESGILSAGPYLVFWTLSFLFSSLADYLITRKIFSIGVTRKIFNCIGLYVPGACVLALALMSTFNSDDATVTLIFLFLSVGVSSAFMSGYNVNHMDIAPAHAGTLMGITNGFGNVASIVAPLTLQYIVTEQGNAKQWATAFYIAVANYIIGNTIYLIFASGEIQHWNT